MKRVVLVDDEPGVVEGLSMMVDWGPYGFQVVGTATDGSEALSLIERIQPEVVITDIRMPKLDGLDLIRRARDDGDTSTRFVIISGHRDFEYARTAITLGVQDCLLKPIYEETLCTTLKSLSRKLASQEKLGVAGGQAQTVDLQRALGEPSPSDEPTGHGGQCAHGELESLRRRECVIVAGRIDNLGILRSVDPARTHEAKRVLRRFVSRILHVATVDGFAYHDDEFSASVLDVAAVGRQYGTVERYAERLVAYTSQRGDVTASFVTTPPFHGIDEAKLWWHRLPRLLESLRTLGPGARVEAEHLTRYNDIGRGEQTEFGEFGLFIRRQVARELGFFDSRFQYLTFQQCYIRGPVGDR